MRNKFIDFSGEVTPQLKRVILETARREYPTAKVNITVRRKKFYFLDRPGHVEHLVVEMHPYVSALQSASFFVKGAEHEQEK